MYWSNIAVIGDEIQTGIFRCNVDGTQVETVVKDVSVFSSICVCYDTVNAFVLHACMYVCHRWCILYGMLLCYERLCCTFSCLCTHHTVP